LDGFYYVVSNFGSKSIELTTFQDDIKPIVSEVMETLRKGMKSEQEAQGHKLTGKLGDSIEYEISPDGRDMKATMFAADYGVYVELGVTASRIPYGGRSGNTGGGTDGHSLYIEGLVSFWELRGLSGREAVNAAFATAQVHARQGMPTNASYRFSSTGERTGFVRATVEKNLEGIGKVIEDKYGAILELRILEAFKPENTGLAPGIITIYG
jgi:hypothetical protein